MLGLFKGSFLRSSHLEPKSLNSPSAHCSWEGVQAGEELKYFEKCVQLFYELGSNYCSSTPSILESEVYLPGSNGEKEKIIEQKSNELPATLGLLHDSHESTRVTILT